MRLRRLAVLVLAGVVAVTAAGCGDLVKPAPPGYFSTSISEPRNPLIPANTTEDQGMHVLDALFTPLVNFNDDTKAVEFTGVAQSITSPDNVNWTIKLKSGWTFHNGEPLTASSYVDAWNWSALSTHAYGASGFFSNIVGYDDLQGVDTAPPKATAMRGLRVVDDLTFTVQLNGSFAIFPMTLGCSAFFPLPKAFYRDPDAFGRRPIGNGPFKADEDWQRGVGITLSRYDNYAGPDKAKAKGMEFRVYTEITTSYTDMQAGALDIELGLPPDELENARAEWGSDFVERAEPDITSLAFPLYDKRYADVRVRKAISMGIDREAIVKVLFSDTRDVATSYSSSVISGYRKGACGRLCELHVDEANKLLDDAGFDRKQPIDLWFNSGAGNDDWMQAIGNQLQKNLGLSYRLRSLPFSQYLPLLDTKGMTGPFRFSWIMDYPSIYNFLYTLYGTDSLPPRGSNDVFYSNPAFDALLREGNEAPTIDLATKKYQEAEDLLFKDLPAAPLFYGKRSAVNSKRVSNVKIRITGDIDWSAVEVA